jgi:Na+/H+ antiporter NhaD/arsenite permease-like protein
MDPATKERFRWKFYRLQVLIIAVGVIALFLAPENLQIPVFLILILAALILAVYTGRSYRETKRWLEEKS